MKKLLLPALAALAFATTAPAFAHAHLLTEIPAAEGVIASPTGLTLHFSEGVSLKFTGVVVKGPAGTVIKLDPASLDPKDDKTLIVPVEGTLAAGLYSVAWHALSTDGHKTSGTYAFTVK